MQKSEDHKECMGEFGEKDVDKLCELDEVLRGFTHNAAAAYLVAKDPSTLKLYTVLGVSPKHGAHVLTSFGGKAQPGETPTQTAARELWEEFLQFVPMAESESCFTQGDAHRLVYNRHTVREVNNAWRDAERQLAAGAAVVRAYLVPTFFVSIPWGDVVRMVDAFNSAHKPEKAEITYAELVDISSLFDGQRALTITQMSAPRGSVPAEEQTAFFKRAVVEDLVWPLPIRLSDELVAASYGEISNVRSVAPFVARSLLLSDHLTHLAKIN